MNTDSLTLLAIEAGCKAGSKCATGTTEFWNSAFGGIIQSLLAVAGLLVVIVAVLKVFGKVTSGKMGEAVKIGFGAAIFAAFLFEPQLIGTVIGIFGGMISAVIESFGKVAGIK